MFDVDILYLQLLYWFFQSMIQFLMDCSELFLSDVLVACQTDQKLLFSVALRV